MSSKPVVHVVSRGRSGLARALSGALEPEATVRSWESFPRLSEIEAPMVVADLCDFPGPVDADRLRGLLDRADLWLLVDASAPSTEFLRALTRWPVRCLLSTPEDRRGGFPSVVGALRAIVEGPASADVADLVLSNEPTLEPLGDIVRAFCAQIRDTRRPRDLAMALGLTKEQLKARVASLGFGRVEHFIVALRQLVCLHLMRERRFPASVAIRLAGITDRSNHRRELARAFERSHEGMSRLASLVAEILLPLLLVLSASCSKKAPAADVHADAPAGPAADPRDTAIAVPVVGAVVRRGDLVLTVRTTGQVRAERLVTLKVDAQGTAQAVTIRPGDRVDSGAVLVRLDPRPFDLAVQDAQSAYDDALVRFRDILIGDDTTDTSPIALERRKNARLRAGIDGAEARLERVKLDREHAVIRAPFAGTVDQVHVVAGQAVGPGDAITTVVDLGSLVVDAAVLEHDLPLIRRGAGAVVSLAAASGRAYVGRVVALLPLVDTTTRASRALVRVRTGDGMLRPGMYADVELEATRLADRVLVPASAVIERDGRPLVFRYEGGRAQWVYVTPGRSNGRETEIMADSVTGRPAVAPGDTVLVEGHLTLSHDAPVRLLDGLEHHVRE